MKWDNVINGYFGLIGKYIVRPFVKGEGPYTGAEAILIIGLTVIPVTVAVWIVLGVIWLCLV